VNRFQAPIGGGKVVLAELAGQSWKPIRDVLDLGGVELESGFFGLKTSSGALAFLVRPVPATLGSTRELWQDGVVTRLSEDSKYRAKYPVIQELSGTRFVFNQEFRIFREPPHNDTPVASSTNSTSRNSACCRARRCSCRWKRARTQSSRAPWA